RNNWETRINGVGENYLKVDNISIAAGRFFTPREQQTRARVAILGMTVVSELYEGENPIGTYIKINSSRFLVIGVLKERGSSGFMDSDDTILIPLNTAMKRLMNKEYLDNIKVLVKDKMDLDKVEEELSEKINKLKNVKDEDSYRIRNMASFKDALTGTTKVMSYLL